MQRDADGAWVLGPTQQHTSQPPIAFQLRNEVGAMTLTLSLHWSLWTEAGQPGTAAVAQLLQQLTTRGFVVQ